MEEICICLLSDLHIHIPSYRSRRMKELHCAISTLLKHEEIDAFLILGDLSDHGFYPQQQCVLEELSRLQKPVYFLLGNHDIHHFFTSSTTIFHDLNTLRSSLHDPPLHRIYHTQWIQGIPILMLGSEKRLSTECAFSHAQCAWLKQELTYYQHLPYVLIANHQPLTNTHKGSERLKLGAQDANIKKCLSRYSNVVWVSGHLHTCAFDIQMLNSPYGLLIDTPSFQLPCKRKAKRGCGGFLYLHKEGIRYQIWDFLQDKKVYDVPIKKSDEVSDLKNR